jgi:hypothetical protein
MLEYTQNLSSDVLPDGSEWDFVVEDAHEKELHLRTGCEITGKRLTLLPKSSGWATMKDQLSE